jgi:hypothetical protein
MARKTKKAPSAEPKASPVAVGDASVDMRGGLVAGVTIPASLLLPHISRKEEEEEEYERSDDEPIRILLLCNYDPTNAATVCDHINAFYKYSKHAVTVASRIGALPDELDFNRFDVIIVHYSVFIAIDAYVTPATRQRLGKFEGLKVLFIQDEYRFVDRTIDAINEAGIDIVFTCVPTPEIPKVYPPERFSKTKFINVLTGYVPEGLKLFQPKPLADRRFDVGYRGRVYPAWHGEAGREKYEIGQNFLRDSRGFGLKCNIRWDEESRVYGLDWVNFMRDCRAVLAVESGASVFDFDGWVSARTETFAKVLGLGEKQSRNVKRMLAGRGVYARKSDDRALYEDLRQRFFAEKENLIDLAQLSPRVFEAATLQTLLVMYEGQYSGAFEPWRHYVPLKKDHSNMAQVVEVLKDPIASATIIANCYAEVCENRKYAYSTFIQQFDQIILDAFDVEKRSEEEPYAKDDMQKMLPFYFFDNPHALMRPKVGGSLSNPVFWLKAMLNRGDSRRHLAQKLRKIIEG